jgi:4-amino-4-deoxy-L-arabinose transferase-like glycosyltransferase
VGRAAFPFLLPNGGGEYRGAHSLHPPLPYLLMLPFYGLARALSLPESAQYHVLRLISLALNLAALPLIYQAALAAAPSTSAPHTSTSSPPSSDWSRSVAFVAVAGLVGAPIFGMASGVVNNDASSVFAVALFVWLLCVRFSDEITPKRAAILGLVFGLGMMCKATVALCDGAALLAFLWSRHGLKSKQTWRTLGIALVVAGLVAAPWYARNFALYGNFSPIERGYTNPNLPAASNGPLVMAMHPNFPLLFGYANWGIFYSLWSQKDWFPETIRTPIYLAVRTPIYLALAAAFVVSLLSPLAVKARARRVDSSVVSDEGAERLARSVRAALWASLALNWAVCVAMAMWVHWGWAEGGRYLIAALPAMTLFLSWSLHRIAPPRALQVLAVAGGVLLNGVAVYWLLAYLNPTFGPK